MTELSDYLALRAEKALKLRQAAQKEVGHDDDPAMLVDREIAILRMPMEVSINYLDAVERPTTRTIQIRNYDGYYIKAFCLMRRGLRTFIVRRVQDAFDHDGQLITSFPDFLEVFFGENSLSEEAKTRQRYWRHVADRIAPELLLLRVLAAADGSLAPAEAAVVADHALALLAKREVPGERSALIRYVARLSGTRETVTNAMAFMATQSGARRKRFGEACLALVQADGHVDDGELAILRAFESSGSFG